MPHDTPHTVAAKIRPFLTVQFQLRIGKSLHSETNAEQAHAQRPQSTRHLRLNRERRRGHPERQSKRKRDERQERSLGQELLKESRIPESLVLFLQFIVARVVLAAAHGPRHDAVEQACAPESHGAEQKFLGPGEDVPGSCEGDVVVVHAAADGAPPGVGDLAGGPVVVLYFASVCCSRGGIAGEGEAGVQGERWEKGGF